MNIELFNRNYWVRRFGSQEYVQGYATTTHEDFVASLNVYPASDSEQAVPEGERRLTRLSAAGSDVLVAADHDHGVKGDLLFYHGRWYECVSAEEWDHTILSHWNYQFMLVPKDAAGTIDLEDPVGSPDGQEGGGDDEDK